MDATTPHLPRTLATLRRFGLSGCSHLAIAASLAIGLSQAAQAQTIAAAAAVTNVQEVVVTAEK